MGLRILQVDAFTDHPFAGNPAAVCVLPEAKPDSWMQKVALEMNLSETALLVVLLLMRRKLLAERASTMISTMLIMLMDQGLPGRWARSLF